MGMLRILVQEDCTGVSNGPMEHKVLIKGMQRGRNQRGDVTVEEDVKDRKRDEEVTWLPLLEGRRGLEPRGTGDL